MMEAPGDVGTYYLIEIEAGGGKAYLVTQRASDPISPGEYGVPRDAAAELIGRKALRAVRLSQEQADFFTGRARAAQSGNDHD